MIEIKLYDSTRYICVFIDEDAFSHLVYHVGQTVESVFVNCNENQLICQPLETHQQLQDMNLALNECYDAGMCSL